jgi:hypothetical protein
MGCGEGGDGKLVDGRLVDGWVGGWIDGIEGM